MGGVVGGGGGGEVEGGRLAADLFQDFGPWAERNSVVLS